MYRSDNSSAKYLLWVLYCELVRTFFDDVPPPLVTDTESGSEAELPPIPEEDSSEDSGEAL